jgi:hypothetical protein
MEIVWIQALLHRQGQYTGAISGQWDETTELALRALIGMENLEERYQGGPALDETVLQYLKEKFA